MRVGVLALQGDFALHQRVLARCGVDAPEVSRAAELEHVDGLVLPGGESTTLLTLLDTGGLVPALRRFHDRGRPLFGTCAGLILLAREVMAPPQLSLGLIDLGVERNAWGRQRESFVASGRVTLEAEPVPCEMVFIRAPRIRHVGPGVRVLGAYAGEPVLAEEGRVLVAAFHPELTEDLGVHRYFCGMVGRALAAR